MTIFKAVVRAAVTIIIISVLANIFNSVFNEIALWFLLGQVASITTQLHVINEKSKAK